MPEYPLICNPCGHRWDARCSYADLPAQRCPGCGATDHHQDYAAKGIRTGIEYISATGGGRSITEGCSKREVGEYRRLLAREDPGAAAMVQDNGTVVYGSRRDALRFRQAKLRARRRAEEHAAARAEAAKRRGEVTA